MKAEINPPNAHFIVDAQTGARYDRYIERVMKPAAQRIKDMHNVKVGDWVVSLIDKRDLTSGERYKVVSFDSDMPVVIDDADEVNYLWDDEFKPLDTITQQQIPEMTDNQVADLLRRCATELDERGYKIYASGNVDNIGVVKTVNV